MKESLVPKKACVRSCRAFNARPQSLILFNRKEPLKGLFTYLFIYSTKFFFLNAYYKPVTWDKTQSLLSSLYTGGERDR